MESTTSPSTSSATTSPSAGIPGVENSHKVSGKKIVEGLKTIHVSSEERIKHLGIIFEDVEKSANKNYNIIYDDRQQQVKEAQEGKDKADTKLENVIKKKEESEKQFKQDKLVAENAIKKEQESEKQFNQDKLVADTAEEEAIQAESSLQSVMERQKNDTKAAADERDDRLQQAKDNFEKKSQVECQTMILIQKIHELVVKLTDTDEPLNHTEACEACDEHLYECTRTNLSPYLV